MKFWNENKNRTRLIGAGCLGLAVLAGVGGLWGYRRYQRSREVYLFSDDAKDGGYVMPEIAYNEMMETMEQSYFRIQINARPELKNGRCNLMIGNPAENKEDVQVTLILDDTGGIIYQSETLKPGQRNAYVTMETGLSPGDYPVTAVFHILDPESGTAIGEIEAGAIITVSAVSHQENHLTFNTSAFIII